MDEKTIAEINNQIIGLWKNHSGQIKLSYWPSLIIQSEQNTLGKGSVLFVGLNPSFNKKQVSETDWRSYQWNGYNKESKKKIDDLEESCFKYHHYFDKIKDLAKDIGEEKNWSYIDLFYYRVTNQKELEKIIKNKKANVGSGKEYNVCDLNDFGLDQLKISKGLIDSIEPKLIIFVNSLASKIFKKYAEAKIDGTILDKKGYHLYNSIKPPVPLFFSSMLSGKRALDLDSFDRLSWHIKTALAQQKKGDGL